MSTAIRTNAGVLTNAVIGTAPSAALGPGPLRLAGLATRTTATILAVTASGDVQASVLASSDLPVPIVLPATGVAPPSASPRSLGTRIVYYPAVPADVDYAVGIDTNTLWQSVPIATQFAWYQGTTPRMRLYGDGTLRLENGAGVLELASLSGGTSIIGGSSLTIASSGHIPVVTGANSACYPTKGYWSNLGILQNKWLSLHAAELWVETLIAASTQATIGGRLLIGATTSLVKPQTNSAEFFGIFVRHNQMANEDRVRLEAAGQFEIWRIISAPTTHLPDAEVPFTYYSYSVQRILGGPWTWAAGDAVFNTGQTGAGFIDLYSMRGTKASDTGVSSEFGPTIVGNVRGSLAATDWAPRWAIGNLSGLYANPTGVYGAAFGSPSGAHMQIDATYGVNIMAGDNRSTGQWDMSGNLRIGYQTGAHLYMDVALGAFRIRDNGGFDRVVFDSTGAGSLWSGLTVGDAGKPTVPLVNAGVKYLRSALAGNWNSGRGFYFHYDPADEMTRALIGNAATERLQWDGTNIRLVGTNVEISPETGITVKSTPSATWSANYGYNLTSLAYGGHASMWGFEGANEVGWGERMIVLDNQTTLASTYASHIFQGEGRLTSGAAAKAYNLTLESNPQYNVSELKFIGDYVTYLSGQFRIVGNTLLGTDTRNTPYLLELVADSAYKPGSTLWTITPSNRDAKTGITPVDRAAALETVRRTTIQRFTYTGARGSPAGLVGIGIVAEDHAAILPNSLTYREDGTAGWNAHELIMLTIAAVQALADRLEALEDKE